MYLGQSSSSGRWTPSSRRPTIPYTEALLSAVPVPDPDAQRAAHRPRGAAPERDGAAGRLPVQHALPPEGRPICDDTPPPEQSLARGHRIACHIPADELSRLQMISAASRLADALARPAPEMGRGPAGAPTNRARP